MEKKVCRAEHSPPKVGCKHCIELRGELYRGDIPRALGALDKLLARMEGHLNDLKRPPKKIEADFADLLDAVYDLETAIEEELEKKDEL